MKTEDILEIIIPTFNRKPVLEQTLGVLLHSPAGKCQVTVLDNNSADDTEPLVKSLMPFFPNLKYVKNRFNLGLAGNFCKAMMLPEKKYFWIMSDDTGLDFAHWNEVEKALAQDYDVLLTLNYYGVKDCKTVKEQAQVILMLIWMFSGIFKSSLVTDDLILRALTDIYTVHPQIALITKAVSKQNVWLPPYPITAPRENVESAEKREYSFNRNAAFRHFRLDQPMNFFPGFLNAVENIEDPVLKKTCIELIFKYSFVKYNSNHFKHIRYHRVNFWDTFLLLPFKYKLVFLAGALKYHITHPFGRKHEK